jgi:hypothetical protein
LGRTDSAGNFLSGTKAYRLHLPTGIPAKLFSSVTAYDALTASGLDNGQPFPSINSMDKPATNADASTDFYFGPASPGDGKNRLRIVPQKRFLRHPAALRPDRAFFNQPWRPSDL